MLRMPIYAYAILAAGWVAWMARFLIVQRNRQHAQQVDRSARWGILLEVIAFALLWQNSFLGQAATVMAFGAFRSILHASHFAFLDCRPGPRTPVANRCWSQRRS